jgi:hypothetical protein
MITEQERRRRRLTYRFVQLGLIMLSVGIVVAFFSAKRSSPRERGPDVSITRIEPAQTQTLLGPGDAQLFNVDTTVELLLRGDKMLAGLSPKMVERIRSEIQDAGPRDKDGIGAAIATAVKEQVASAIAYHAEYNVRDIDDIRYEGEQIVVQWKTGKEQELFGSIKKDGRRGEANQFRRDEALRFIELVKARQGQLNR